MSPTAKIQAQIQAQIQCPGIIKLHKAQDSLVMRVRNYKNYLTAKDWKNLANCLNHGLIHRASQHSEQKTLSLEITSRKNLQIRGINKNDNVKDLQKSIAQIFPLYKKMIYQEHNSNTAPYPNATPNHADDRKQNIIANHNNPVLLRIHPQIQDNNYQDELYQLAKFLVYEKLNEQIHVKFSIVFDFSYSHQELADVKANLRVLLSKSKGFGLISELKPNSVILGITKLSQLFQIIKKLLKSYDQLTSNNHNHADNKIRKIDSFIKQNNLSTSTTQDFYPHQDNQTNREENQKLAQVNKNFLKITSSSKILTAQQVNSLANLLEQFSIKTSRLENSQSLSVNVSHLKPNQICQLEAELQQINFRKNNNNLKIYHCIGNNFCHRTKLNTMELKQILDKNLKKNAHPNKNQQLDHRYSVHISGCARKCAYQGNNADITVMPDISQKSVNIIKSNQCNQPIANFNIQQISEIAKFVQSNCT